MNETDATLCAVCGGPFSTSRVHIEGRQYHDRCAVLAWHKHWTAAHTAQWYGSWWGQSYPTGAFDKQPTHWQPLPAPPSEPVNASKDGGAK